MLKAKYLLFLLPLLFQGCISLQKCRAKFPCLTKDTTIINYIKKDTNIIVPADYSYLNAWIKCDSNNIVLIDSIETINGKKSSITYKFKDRVTGNQVLGKILSVTATCDSLNIYLTWKEKHEKVVTNKTEVVTVHPKWFVYVKWILILILAIVLALVALKFTKRR
jgi:hypothetical protein